MMNEELERIAKGCELLKVLNEIKQEMIEQNTHSYDINSNDTQEMMFFINEVVKPIVNLSLLDEKKKKEVVGYMIMDINDNSKWSIKKGVNNIISWYKYTKEVL